MTRRRRRILVASAVALAAGAATILGLAAAASAWLDSSTPVLLALAAVFVTQPLYVLARPRRKDRP